jgi:hypothetical protein
MLGLEPKYSGCGGAQGYWSQLEVVSAGEEPLCVRM